MDVDGYYERYLLYTYFHTSAESKNTAFRRKTTQSFGRIKLEAMFAGTLNKGHFIGVHGFA